MRTRSEALPVGLYGMLLFALCWLTLPAVFAPCERVLVGIGCALPRLAALWSGAPALAAHDGSEPVAVGALSARIVDHDLRAPSALPASGLQPLHCSVVAGGRLGGGGVLAELRLDHSYAELAGCSEWVTKGDRLLGVLARLGTGSTANDQPGDPARVLLLNHPAARAQFAAMRLPDGGELHFVVRAAAGVDPAPLRVDLWDDPYRAARLDQPGAAVFTRDLPELAGAPPGGLRLGKARLWGYAGSGAGDSVLLGVFVDPEIEADALSHVVLWRAAPALNGSSSARGLQHARTAARIGAVLHELPGVSAGRHLLVLDAAIGSGAAVVDGDRLLGTAQGLVFGAALMTSFAASHRRWNLLLLPNDGALAPVEFAATVEHRGGDVVVLRRRRSDGGRLPEGELFTGCNGVHCPAGLRIGRAGPHPSDSDLFEVVVPGWRGPLAVAVLDGGAR